MEEYKDRIGEPVYGDDKKCVGWYEGAKNGVYYVNSLKGGLPYDCDNIEFIIPEPLRHYGKRAWVWDLKTTDKKEAIIVSSSKGGSCLAILRHKTEDFEASISDCWGSDGYDFLHYELIEETPPNIKIEINGREVSKEKY